MKSSRVASSAGLGLALCIAASSTAFADDAETSQPASPASDQSVSAPDAGEATETEAGTEAAPDSATDPSPEPGPAPAAESKAAPEPDANPEPDAEPASPSDAPAAPPATTAAPAAEDGSQPASNENPAKAANDADDAAADEAAADQAGATSVAPADERADATVPVAAAATIGIASAGQTVTTVADGLTPFQLAQYLAGAGVTISNVTYTGHPTAAGIADGISAIGLVGGVALSSGSLQVTDDDKGGLVGPNESAGWSSGLGQPGDSDLDALLSGGDATNDAAVLEFDVVPTGTQLIFHYVFASEEYNEWVNSYNDVFGFYVNGVNCATINGAPISINNINKDVNSGSYVNNDPSDFGGTAPHDVEPDGFTTVLTCSASVNPGQPNRIKLAIADARDSAFDTLVIIQAGSFTSADPPKASNDAYSTKAGETLVVVVPGLVGNDSQSPGGGPLAAVKVSDPKNGTVTINADGSFSYVPNPGFIGQDTFTYLVTDAWGNSNVATVTIDVLTGEVTPVVTPAQPVPPPKSIPTPATQGAGTKTTGTKATPVQVKTHASGGPSLAATGIDLLPLGSISLTLLAAGIAATTVGRRRQTS
ncbi:choice-of-anchor L domain-containing protein [Blastococcus sp. Marseille-P5729]|uniref:choice-of-anchor L domain-containing protein n=1 Tax=Blastococcus sp. Marseille-P5729 TaxID=2086582 RepID=UPI000D0F4F5B|nr:choice-of-anchor L domain-containing protein [Blastococcus sp. Marseille-P5729]